MAHTPDSVSLKAFRTPKAIKNKLPAVAVELPPEVVLMQFQQCRCTCIMMPPQNSFSDLIQCEWKAVKFHR